MEYSFAFGREHSSQRRNMLALVMFDRLELAGGQGGVKCCGSGAATSGIGAVRPKVSTSADTALRLLTPPCQRRTHRTHGCAPLKRRRRSSTGACSSPLGRHGGQVQEQVFCRNARHARAAGLDAADHLLCEGAVCTRLCDLVLRRCHAAPVGALAV